MTKLTEKEVIERFLSLKEVSCKNCFNEFQRKFKKDPYWAFEWSASTFEDAATLYTIRLVRIWYFKQKISLSTILVKLQEKIMKGAKWPQKSTCDISNHLHRCKLAKLTQLYEELKAIYDEFNQENK